MKSCSYYYRLDAKYFYVPADICVVAINNNATGKKNQDSGGPSEEQFSACLLVDVFPRLLFTEPNAKSRTGRKSQKLEFPF